MTALIFALRVCQETPELRKLWISRRIRQLFLSWNTPNQLLIVFSRGSAKMDAKTLAPNDIPVESASLFQPPLEEITQLLSEKLKNNFKEVSVEVVDCPDLTQKPYSLACKGLGGHPTIVEVGGVPYLLPKVKREKLYDLRDVPELVGLKSAYITGAGAGPWNYAKTNCELIVNMGVVNKTATNLSRIGKVDTSTGNNLQEILPDSACESAVLSNLFVSEGQPSKVLKIVCKVRTGSQDFITSIRTSLQEHYGTKPVGLGGVFIISDGKVKQHVMPDFSTAAINSEDELNNWLKFYNMSTPLIALGTLVSADPGLDLRVQHFHSFSHHGDAGHYHIDTTPETIVYEAYFNVGEKIYRLDKPKVTHNIGRD